MEGIAVRFEWDDYVEISVVGIHAFGVIILLKRIET